MENEITNRVAKSGIVTFDLEELFVPGERVIFDLKDLLSQELILREKEFRERIKNHTWSLYQDKLIALTCSEDIIIPTWAYMLVASSLQPYAKSIVHGSLQELENFLFVQQLQKIDWPKFQHAKVVVKGCSKIKVPTTAYVEVINQLKPFASSIMFGEACSSVPIFKKKDLDFSFKKSHI